MKSTLDYLEEAKKAARTESDNAFGLKIGITRASMNSYKKHRSVMDDYTCIKVAGILGINPMEVIAAANYEREKNEEKKAWWENFIKQSARSTAATVLLASIFAGSLSMSQKVEAHTNGISDNSNALRLTIIRSNLGDYRPCFFLSFHGSGQRKANDWPVDRLVWIGRGLLTGKDYTSKAAELQPFYWVNMEF